MNLQPIFDRHLPPLEQALRQTLQTSRPDLEGHYGMMHYHMGWVDKAFNPIDTSGGKRVRPLLCLLVAEATGGNTKQAMPAAVALEMLHNFSLVHDDIEDNSTTRRGRPAVWTVWGVPQAINMGDGLFAMTHTALGQLVARGVSPERALWAMRVFNAACISLTEGQFMDMRFEERVDVTPAEYLQMIRGKTAALISVACQMGAILGGAATETVDAYARFGEYLGLAFQIQDDWLGVWGEETVTGKPVGDDIRERKKNFPVVYALDQLAASGDRRLRELYAREQMDSAAVGRILEILGQTGAEAHTLQTARAYHDQALAALDAAGVENQAQQWLRDLANALVSRRS